MSDSSQLYLELAADAMSIQKLLEDMKQPSLYRFALHYAPGAFSQESLSKGTNATDLTIYLSDDVAESLAVANVANGNAHRSLYLRAVYNQRIFSSFRISSILAQLLQIIQNASSGPQDPIGKIDLMTEAQKELLPDPRKDLHW